ncbi:MAG: hypothetical protein KDK41_15375 [Leptospiraceae bacterium]|nr:hypothetical protein [Leptospiraceae bacterium]
MQSLGDLFSPAAIKLATALAVVGAIVALLASLFAGANWVAWLYRPVLAAVFMGILGFAIHFILKSTAPEIVEVFSENPPVQEEGSTTDNAETENTEETNLSESEFKDTSYDDSDAMLRSSSQTPRRANKDVVAGDGEIVVEGVKLKNEPKVMAEAIKHLMDQDDDS